MVISPMVMAPPKVTVIPPGSDGKFATASTAFGSEPPVQFDPVTQEPLLKLAQSIQLMGIA